VPLELVVVEELLELLVEVEEPLELLVEVEQKVVLAYLIVVGLVVRKLE